MTTKWAVVARVLLVVFPAVLCVGLLWRWWPYPKQVMYSLYRDQGKARTMAELQGYHTQSSEHFDIFYTNGDENVVGMILETAESMYDGVVSQIGFTPDARIPLIVHPSRDSLRTAFGWGNGESAMGVYWKGTIRLLSPNVWIDEDDPRVKRKVFKRINPIAHELAHYLLDYRTDGNYPRWFTEGLAQRIEHDVSGYLWIEPESTLRQPLYSMEDLGERFDQLNNQPLAYRQSYLLVTFMAKEYGEERLTDLIDSLADKVPFHRAFHRAFGVTAQQAYQQWYEWVQENLDQLEPVE